MEAGRRGLDHGWDFDEEVLDSRGVGHAVGHGVRCLLDLSASKSERIPHTGLS